MHIFDATKTPPGMATPETLYQALGQLEIPYSIKQHPPVYTVDEAKELRGEISGAHCKSLFLQNKKGTLWLIICLEWRRINIKVFAETLNTSRLSFASPETLAATLGIYPGAVTPFSIINDKNIAEQKVRVVLDADMMGVASVNFHPLVNNFTINLKPRDLVRFLVFYEHAPMILDFDPLTAK